MQGSIDQVEELIFFDTKEELQHWDDQIQAICTQVNNIVDTCASKGIEAL